MEKHKKLLSSIRYNHIKPQFTMFSRKFTSHKILIIYIVIHHIIRRPWAKSQPSTWDNIRFFNYFIVKHSGKHRENIGKSWI